MTQKMDSKMLKHLEEGGLVTACVKGGPKVAYNHQAAMESLFLSEKVWEYKAEPKYVYRRVLIRDDGSESVDLDWYPTKVAFMRGWSSSKKFGPWQRRLATEACDD